MSRPTAVRHATMIFLLAGAATFSSVGSPAQQAAKPPIHGLVTMGRQIFVKHPEMTPDNSLREANAHPEIYSGAVINVTWQQLEPAEGQFDFAAIDAGLAAVRAYNARYQTTPLRGKLRVFGGVNAPSWVKQLDGGPIEIAQHHETAALGHFWAASYAQAWRLLQQKLAARYDADPDLGEVAVASCSSRTAEPFAVANTKQDLPVVLRAGYTDEAMKQCLLGALDDYAVWVRTPIDYTFSPWRNIDSGRTEHDPAFTATVMKAFRQRFGARAVIANHGLSAAAPPALQPVLDDMRRLGPPSAFQTSSGPIDWNATVALARQMGATEFEIPDTQGAGGDTPVSQDQLLQWRQDFSSPQ